MTENIDKRPMFRQTVDTLTLIKTLLKVAVGETITYEALSQAIGMDVVQRRSSLQSARKHLIRVHRILFETIKRVGLRRMNSADAVDCLTAEIKRVGRAAKRGLNKSTCVEEDELSQDQKLSWYCSQSLLMMQHASAHFKARKSLIGKVKAQGRVLPYGHTLEAMQNTS